ncbi:MAG TPA: hypothetical protein VGP76_21060 [Planctomycetaceae bacterium]|jgi:hypothetical protein|nr:hypothetical protein [Planctomycetaceae bacterium]
MVAGERFAKVPPDALGWICLGYVFGKEVRDNSMAASSQIGTHGVAIVQLGVVETMWITRIAPQLPTQVVEASQEEGCVAFPEPTTAIDPSSREASQPDAVFCCCQRNDLGLLAAKHPPRADLGVHMDIRFVLEHTVSLAGN